MFMLSSIVSNAVKKYNTPTITHVANVLFSTKSSTNTIVFKDRILALNDLYHATGAVKKRKRWGRGIGSDKGKNCGYGHQHSTATPRGFEGGQTPLYKRLPKIGFTNPNKKDIQVLNLDKIQEYIDMGRFVPNPDGLNNIRDLYNCGLVSQVKEGVKLLAKHKRVFKSKVHLEVSSASKNAIAAIEAAGGTVTCVHFNRLALRALVKPLKFELLPRRARPPPGIIDYYLDHTRAGYLSPEIQIRNLKLFGYVTSEKILRDEHTLYMDARRVEMKKERDERKKFIHLLFDSSTDSNNTNNDNV